MKLKSLIFVLYLIMFFSCKQKPKDVIENLNKDSLNGDSELIRKKIRSDETYYDENKTICDTIITAPNFNYKCLCSQSLSNPELKACLCEQVMKADSIVDRIYRKIINSLDSEIVTSKNNLKNADKDSKEFEMRRINENIKLKKAIIVSQKQWRQMLDANSNVVEVFYDGGTGQTADVAADLLMQLQQRIEWLSSYFDYVK